MRISLVKFSAGAIDQKNTSQVTNLQQQLSVIEDQIFVGLSARNFCALVRAQMLNCLKSILDSTEKNRGEI